MTRRVQRPHKRSGPKLAIADPDKRDRLMKAIAAGVPLTQAVLHAGMGERTLFRTLERGEEAQARLDEGEALDDDEEMCRELWVEVRAARSQVAVRNVALVQKAATGGYVRKEKKRRFKDDSGRWVTETDTEYADVDWRAATWLLERSFRGDFAPVSAARLELTGADGGPVQVGHNGAQIAGLAERLALAAQQQRAEDADPNWDVHDAELVDDEDDLPD